MNEGNPKFISFFPKFSQQPIYFRFPCTQKLKMGLLCRSSLWKVLHLRRRPPRPIQIFCFGWIKGSLCLPPWNCRIQRLHPRFQICFLRIIQWDRIQDRRIAMLLEIQWCPPRTSRGKSKWNNRLVTQWLVQWSNSFL